MKNQLRGIAVLLFALLLIIVFGDKYFFDLNFRWNAVFTVMGAAGLALALYGDGKSR